MPLKELQKILANIVLLPGADVTVNFPTAELERIFRDPSLQIQANQAPNQLTQQIQVTSLREQLVFLMRPGQLIIEDKSADIPPKYRVPEIVSSIATLLGERGLQFRGYGYNFHIAFDVPGEQLAADFLATKYVNVARIQEIVNSNLSGAGLRLFFDLSKAACDLRLEPKDGRPNSPQLLASINYHYSVGESGLPDSETMRSDFAGKWTLFQQTLEGLVQ